MKKRSQIAIALALLSLTDVYGALAEQNSRKDFPAGETIAAPLAEKISDDLPDISLYHISYLGSLTNSGQKVVDVFNGNTLEKQMVLSYNGVIGVEKKISGGLGGFLEYGFSQKLIDIKYSTDGNYFFRNSSEGKNLVAMRVDENFRLVAGLYYAWRLRKYIIFQGGLGYINVNQLTYYENRVTPPLTVTQSFGANFIGHEPKTDAIRTDATFHGVAFTANLILTPFEAVHFPISIRYNTVFTPSRFSENAQLPSSIQELWLGTGVRLVI